MKKKYLFSVLMLLFSFGTKAQEHLSLSQPTVYSLSKDLYKTSYKNAPEFGNIDQVERDFYLEKSRNQQTAAWILLGGGTVLIGTAYLLGNRSNSSFNDAATGVALAGIGVVAGFSSIPLFIASKKNKVKAKLTISLDRLPATGKQMRGIGVSIPIG